MNDRFTACDFSKLSAFALSSIMENLLKGAREWLDEATFRPELAELEAILEALNKALRQNKRNQYTKARAEASRAMDEAWSAIWMTTKSNIKHPNLKRRKEIAAVYDLIYQHSNVRKFGYNEKYGRIDRLLHKLEELGAERLELALVREWVEALRQRLEHYARIEKAHLEEEGQYQTGIVRQRQREAERAVNIFLRRVEARVLLEGKAPYENFIAYMNAFFSKENENIRSRRTRSQNREAEKKAEGKEEKTPLTPPPTP